MKLDEQSAGIRAKFVKSLGIESFPCDERYWHEWKKCKEDPCYFIKTYGHTYDPRREEGDRWIPFALWSRQEELIQTWKECEEGKEGCLVEKSRDTGVSWSVVGYTAWRTVFFMDENTGFGAALEEQVDHPESEKAIMWKLRGFLDRLPKWQLPKGYRSTFKNLVNPNTGSRIEGQAGLQIGRGGRTGRYFIDEFAFVANSQAVIASVSANTNCLFPLSTPNGVGNAFYELKESDAIKVFTFHYTDDPRKDDAWAEKEKKRVGAVIFAQEYDLDYTSSREDIVIPGEWVRAAVNYPLKEQGPFLAGLDIGAGVEPTNVVAVRRGPIVKGVVRKSGKVVNETLDRVFEELSAAKDKDGNKCTCLAFDASGPTGSAASKHLSNRDLPFKVMAFIGQKDPSHMMWPDGKRSDQKFLNMRTEEWWKLRERFRKTYERKVHDALHPDEECVSIPNDPKLIAEFSKPLYKFGEDGKLRVESKASMKARNVKSPDSADAVVYCFIAQPFLPQRKGVFEGYAGAAV